MRDWFYPTAFSCWGDEEYAAMDRVRASGKYTMGEEVAAFEREFADYHGRKHGIMTNSGSSANLIAFAAAVESGRLRRGDRIAVPAIAWPTTYAPIVQYGMALEVVDVDTSWNMDLSLLRDVQGTCPVLICPILGNPMHMDEYPLAIVEDCCESLGAVTASGRKCGTFGLLSTFSFFHSHQISAIEGGMILTDDDELAELCRMLRAHGWTRGTSMQREGFENEYDFRVFGYNVRPTEMHAAIAREQLKKLLGFVRARWDNLIYFWDLVSRRGLPIYGPIMPVGCTPSPFGIAFVVPLGRGEVATALRARGIDARPPTGGSFTRHRYGEHWSSAPTPTADFLHQNALFIGNAPFDIRDKIDVAIDVLAAGVLA